MNRDQIKIVKTHAQHEIAQLRANPKPQYRIFTRLVSWESYIEETQSIIDWCDEKLDAGHHFLSPLSPTGDDPYQETCTECGLNVRNPIHREATT